jgi:hypothetical protein
VAAELFHTNTGTDGRTDGLADWHKNANSPFSQLFVRFEQNMTFLEKFSKIHQTFLYKMLSRGTQRERYGR